jgi:SAM-dependent methyltransferase
VAIKHELYRVGVRVALAALCARGTYQPVEVGGRRVSSGRRGTRQRYEALLPALQEANVSTVLDLGCAEGFIVRRLAEQGIFALGVDDNVRALTTAHLSMAADGVQGWGLVRLHLDADNTVRLPRTDGTVFLSVMHHVILEHGLENATKMLRTIRARTEKVLIFEMGQSNETAFSWASRLPDMGTTPHNWIATWLEECGFNDVRLIERMVSYNSDVERAIFAASTH